MRSFNSIFSFADINFNVLILIQSPCFRVYIFITLLSTFFLTNFISSFFIFPFSIFAGKKTRKEQLYVVLFLYLLILISFSNTLKSIVPPFLVFAHLLIFILYLDYIIYYYICLDAFCFFYTRF